MFGMMNRLCQERMVMGRATIAPAARDLRNSCARSVSAVLPAAAHEQKGPGESRRGRASAALAMARCAHCVWLRAMSTSSSKPSSPYDVLPLMIIIGASG